MSNLVVNGDFSNDLVGWTLIDQTSSEQNKILVSVNNTNLLVVNVDMYPVIDTPIVSQVITTNENTKYKLSFNSSSSSASLVTWLINGVQLPNVEFNIGSNWSNYSFNFVSNSTNTTITLLVKSIVSNANLAFDDVSVTLVPTPTITNFSNISVPFGTRQIILEPSSNSDGAINYTSSQETVATVSGNTVSILGLGETTITLNQEETSSYLSGSVSITLTVIPSSSNNRVIINNKDDLLYFLKTNSSFAKINNAKDITNELLNVLGINKNIV